MGGTSKKIIPFISNFSVAWFRVKAVNQYGQSDFSKLLMINAGTGIVKYPLYDYKMTPPILQQVTVLRAMDHQTPIGFARFGETTCDCLKPQVVYQAEWNHPYEQNTSNFNVIENIPIKPDRAVYFFLRFTYQMGRIALTLSFKDPYGAMVNRTIALVPLPGGWSDDYWGSFVPDDFGHEYEYQMYVSGADNFERYYERGFQGNYIWSSDRMGNILDKNPSSYAHADLNNPPQFPFINYEPGVDVNHKIKIGTVTRSLPADRLENNNSFTSATNVVLTLNPSSLRAEYTNINLNSATDTDTFLVNYQDIGTNYIINADSTLAALAGGIVPGGIHWLSKYLGLSIALIEPKLHIELYTNQKECTDLELYKSDKTTRVSEYKKQSCVDLSPGTFPDCKYYLVVKNSDYNLQGAFPYKIIFTYSPGYYRMCVDHNAPAFQPKDRLDYKILKKLYEKIDLPRPSEDWRITIERDIRTFIRQTANILLDTEFTRTLPGISEQSTRTEFANDYRLTAKVASSFGLNEEAEKLYNERINLFSSKNDISNRLDALNELHSFYTSAGMKAKATALKKKIVKIKL
jgi:hypothetical protein